MKTSSKLLIGLVAVILAGLVCTNFVLKYEYEDIKLHPRPQYGFHFVEVPAFSHVKVNSLSPQIHVYIQQSNQRSVQLNDSLSVQFKTHVANDTLFVELPVTIPAPTIKGESAPKYATDEYFGIVIRTSKLASVSVENGSCRLENWQRDQALIELYNKSKVEIRNAKINKLYVDTHQLSEFNLIPDSKIKNLYASKSDSSKVSVSDVLVGSVQVIK